MLWGSKNGLKSFLNNALVISPRIWLWIINYVNHSQRHENEKVSNKFFHGESIIGWGKIYLDSSSWILSTRMKLLHTREDHETHWQHHKKAPWIFLHFSYSFLFKYFFHSLENMWKIINFGAVLLSRRVFNLECTTRALEIDFLFGNFFNIFN